MNVLYIDHYAGSIEMGMEFRPYYFSKEWAKMGHSVTIVSSTYSHLRRKNPLASKDFEISEDSGVKYCWIKTVRYNSNGIKRGISLIQFVGKLFLHVRKLINTFEPDIVICSSTYPLDTFVGQRIKKVSKKKVKLIHEVHDMWPASLYELRDMSKKHPVVKVMGFAEKSFCKNSDYVVSILPAAKPFLMKTGMDESKFRFIPNGVYLDEWANPIELDETIKKHLQNEKKAGKTNICFFGSIHKTYNLDKLINSVIEREYDDISLTIVGPGIDRIELESASKNAGKSIRFFDPIPKRMIPSLLEYVDFVFIGISNPVISKYGVGMNKLIDSMMGAKPIIYMVEDPMNTIEHYQCGIKVKENTVEALSMAIDNALKLSEDDRKLMGENAKETVLKYYNYSETSKVFANLFDEPIS